MNYTRREILRYGLVGSGLVTTALGLTGCGDNPFQLLGAATRDFTIGVGETRQFSTADGSGYSATLNKVYSTERGKPIAEVTIKGNELEQTVQFEEDSSRKFSRSTFTVKRISGVDTPNLINDDRIDVRVSPEK